MHLFVFCCLIGTSQNYPFRNYTIKDGLPSNTVYSLKQDKQGYIWMNTDKGVVKYDGTNFKLYTIENGLVSNDNFSFIMDSKGNKWLYSFKNIIKMDQFDNVSVFGETNSYYSFLFADKNDNIYYLQKINGINKELDSYIFYAIEGDSTYSQEISYSNVPKPTKIYFYNWRGDIYCLIFELDSEKILESYKWDTSTHRFMPNTSETCPKIPMADRFIKAHEFIEIDSVYSILIGSSKYALIKNNKRLFVKDLPFGSYKFTVGDTYKTDGKFFIMLHGGVYEYSIDQNENDTWIPFYLKAKVTGMLKDIEGNIWISTLGEGVFRFYGYGSNAGLNQVTFLSYENIQEVFGIKNRSIWLANYTNQIKNIESKILYDPVGLKDLRFIDSCRNGIIYGGSNGLYFGNKLIHLFGYKYLSRYADTISLASSFGLNFVTLDKLLSNQYNDENFKLNITGRMYAVYYEKGLFYSGNQQGLYWGRPNRDELNPICLDPNEESVSVNGIKKSSDGLIWVSTDGRGVYVVRDKEPVRHFQKELLDGNINSMRIDEQDQVWLATRYGVNRISRNAHGEYQVSKYTSFHGLPSDFVNDTYCYNDTLYVATDAGLVRMDIAEIDRIDFSQPPPVYISKVICTAGSRPFMLKADSSYVLQHDQNFIKIEYSGISYRSNGNITYAYRLLPLISDWRYTGSDLIEFNDLNAGEYTFEVKAINSIGTVSSTPARYSFAIKPHFTRTWWFLTLCGIAITGLIYLAIYYYFDYIRRRNIEKAKIERQLSQLKLQSLQAQLNPHFIFNSLNAVQQLVNDEDLDQANIYLARFAKLMRLYLEGSDNQFITLKQELEVLKLYIQLEHLRFKDKFVYNITISGDVNLDNYQVPAMLLQPHVENAIRHGVSRDTRPGRELNIIVKKQGEEVVVIINDNGIGRVKSLEQKRAGESGHKSMGNKISKQRIEMIRALKLGNIREYIIDLEDNEGIANGTSVEIYISEKPTETITDET